MSHFAKVVDGVVEKVIVAEQDFIDTQEGTWVQTSYNTHGNKHWREEVTEETAVDSDGNEISYTVVNKVETDKAPLRYNYAGIGDTYDAERDAFYAPQPYPSWTLNEDTCLWEPPVAYPDDGIYEWNEDNQEWREV